MANFPTWTCVVAALLVDREGRWLMHRRPPGKAHAGLWEFPGGKVEEGEAPATALVRELAEETALMLREEDLTPLTFAQNLPSKSERRIVILLYKASIWEGHPTPLEGGELAWFEPDRIAALAMPPLDVDLLRRASILAIA